MNFLQTHPANIHHHGDEHHVQEVAREGCSAGTPSTAECLWHAQPGTQHFGGPPPGTHSQDSGAGVMVTCHVEGLLVWSQLRTPEME